MKFRIKCELEVAEAILGDTINKIVSRYSGRILDIKQADDDIWKMVKHAAKHDKPVQLSLEKEPKSDRLTKPQCYGLIVKHGRIGQKRTASEWHEFLCEVDKKNYKKSTVNQCLNVFFTLGLMRKPAEGVFVLDAVLPLHSANAMIKKYDKQHSKRYHQKKKFLGEYFGA